MYKGNSNQKSKLNLFFLILFSFIIGSFAGTFLQDLPYLNWIGASKFFGTPTPFILDLSTLKLTFSIGINISIGSILGLIAGIFIYKRL